ncbi:hypothetical protein COOONC_13336, partial [Cooperia oncophora]
MEAEAAATRSKQLADRLNAELKVQQDENQKLVEQRKAQELMNSELSDRLNTLQEKHDRAENQRNRMQEDMEKFEEKYLAELRQKDDLAKGILQIQFTTVK